MKLTKKMLDVTTPNVVENDLLFITAVLSKIDDVVSKTYGPKAGYVAMVDNSEKATGYSYTKDGMATLDNLKFARATENDLAKLVTNLAYEIKNTSGDGSTTAAKVLFGLVKNCTEYLLEPNVSNRDKSNFRIHTPKGVELLITKLEKKLNKDNNPNIKGGTTQDMIDGAYISLNNDAELLKPMEELIYYLEEKKAPIDETLRIDAFTSRGDKTKVEKKPGYMLGGAQRFSINRGREFIEDAKLIMLDLNITADMLKFIVTDIMSLAESNINKDNIVFLLRDIDHDAQVYLDNIQKQVKESNLSINFDFIVPTTTPGRIETMKKDLSYLANTEVILFDQSMLEKRTEIPKFVDANGNIREGDEIDNFENIGLVKWTAEFKRNQAGQITSRDYQYGFNKFKALFEKQMAKGKYVNISRLEGAGLCLSLADGEVPTEAFNNYYADLLEQSKSDNEDSARDAKERLYFLNDNMYVINVATRKYDGDRIRHAYRDATKAVTSIARYGYHQGGSVGLFLSLQDITTEMGDEYLEIQNKLSELMEVEEDDRDDKWYRSYSRLINEIDTYKNAISLSVILNTAVGSLVKTLLNDITNDKYIDTDEMSILEEAIENRDIIPEKHIFCNSRVISPVETDLVLTRMALFQFSNLFSSLYIEYSDNMDVAYFEKVTEDIKANLKNAGYKFEVEEELLELNKENLAKVLEEAGFKDVPVHDFHETAEMTQKLLDEEGKEADLPEVPVEEAIPEPIKPPRKVKVTFDDDPIEKTTEEPTEIIYKNPIPVNVSEEQMEKMVNSMIPGEYEIPENTIYDIKKDDDSIPPIGHGEVIIPTEMPEYMRENFPDNNTEFVATSESNPVVNPTNDSVLNHETMVQVGDKNGPKLPPVNMNKYAGPVTEDVVQDGRVMNPNHPAYEGPEQQVQAKPRLSSSITPEQQAIIDLAKKRESEIANIEKDMEEFNKLAYMTPGPIGYTIVPDENGNVPEWYGQTYQPQHTHVTEVKKEPDFIVEDLSNVRKSLI